MRISKKLLIASMLTVLATPAFAETRADEVNNRAAKEQARINQGVQSGSLTGSEAAKLQKHQDKANGDIAKAEADGKVTKVEAKKISHEENRQSKHIHHKKHNAVT